MDDIDSLIADVNLDALSDHLTQLVVDTQQAETPAVMVTPFDASANLLDPFAANLFASEFQPFVIGDLVVVTKPQTTMATIEGQISNIKFLESDLINMLETDATVVALDCNFGHKIHESYTKPVKERKSNRGRKAKPVVKKERKKQGDGSCFNSQLTFSIRYTEVYQIKLFRNGKIQIPHVRPEVLPEVILAARHVAKVCDIIPTTVDAPHELININPTMQNYKFIFVLPTPNHKLDLTAMALEVPNTPCVLEIEDVRYSRVNDTFLTVKYKTPLPHKPAKKTSIKVYLSGKVNISGALKLEHTQIIYNHISTVFVTNRDRLSIITLS